MDVALILSLLNSLEEGTKSWCNNFVFNLCLYYTAMKLLNKLNMPFLLETYMLYVRQSQADSVMGYVCCCETLLSSINYHFCFRQLHHHILMMLSNVFLLGTISLKILLVQIIIVLWVCVLQLVQSTVLLLPFVLMRHV